MEKFFFKNYRTRRFSHKTFEQQADYYVVADVFRADNPTKILDVVQYWGSGDEYIVRHFEEESVPLPKKFYEPFYGEFVNVPSNTPLLRRYTPEDVDKGLCNINQVNTFVHNPDGSNRIFNSIRVFCKIDPNYIKTTNDIRFRNIPDLTISKYLPWWEPDYRAKYKKRYCYVEM